MEREHTEDLNALSNFFIARISSCVTYAYWLRSNKRKGIDATNIQSSLNHFIHTCLRYSFGLPLFSPSYRDGRRGFCYTFPTCRAVSKTSSEGKYLMEWNSEQVTCNERWHRRKTLLSKFVCSICGSVSVYAHFDGMSDLERT